VPSDGEYLAHEPHGRHGFGVVRGCAGLASEPCILLSLEQNQDRNTSQAFAFRHISRQTKASCTSGLHVRDHRRKVITLQQLPRFARVDGKGHDRAGRKAEACLLTDDRIVAHDQDPQVLFRRFRGGHSRSLVLRQVALVMFRRAKSQPRRTAGERRSVARGAGRTSLFPREASLFAA
jgi:hypothetical protein